MNRAPPCLSRSPEPAVLMKREQVVLPDLVVPHKSIFLLEEILHRLKWARAKVWQDRVIVDVGVFHHEIGADGHVVAVNAKLSRDVRLCVVGVQRD